MSAPVTVGSDEYRVLLHEWRVLRDKQIDGPLSPADRARLRVVEAKLEAEELARARAMQPGSGRK